MKILLLLRWTLCSSFSVSLCYTSIYIYYPHGIIGVLVYLFIINNNGVLVYYYLLLLLLMSLRIDVVLLAIIILVLFLLTPPLLLLLLLHYSSSRSLFVVGHILLSFATDVTTERTCTSDYKLSARRRDAMRHEEHISLKFHMNLWFLLLLANLADNINSAPAPSYVVSVKDTKMPSTLPVQAPPFPATTAGMGEYRFASDGILMTAANGRKFRCFMDSALRAAGHGDDKTMNELVQQLEQKKERKVRKVKRKVKKVVKRKKACSNPIAIETTEGIY